MIHLNAAQVAAVLGGDVNGNNVTAPGPNNHDKRKDRSMSITIDPNAPDGFLVYSHSEKNTDMECKEYIRAKLGLPEWKPEKSHLPPPPKPKVVCHYIYQDSDGQPYLRVTRMSDKSFRQAHWAMVDDISEIYGWKNGKPKGAVVPYRLPDIQARPSDTIWLVEGEKDADNLHAIGLLATTAPGGGSAFPLTPDFGQWFDGRKVVAIADNDATGAKWRERVTHAVADVVHLSMPAPHKDVSDWLKAGGTLPELLEMAANPPELDLQIPQVQTDRSAITPTPFTWVEPQDIPQREVIYGSHLFRKFVSATVSPGGLGKSSMVMVEALAMAANKPLLGEPIYDGPHRVWYWNGEDPQDENTRRIVAAAKHHNLTPSEFAPNLWVDSGRHLAIKLATMARGDMDVKEEVFVEIEQAIIERRIDVLVLDPFVSIHSVPENDNGAIDAIVKRLGIVADRCNCAIELVHHVRKPGGGSTARTDIHDARGAGSLIAGVRSGRVLNVMSEEEASDAKIAVEDRFSYFSIDNGKANLSKRDGRSQWRQLVSVDLGNDTPIRPGDQVGVVDKYEPPKSMKTDLWPSNAAEIAQRIAEEDDTLKHWTGSGQIPGDWFGFAVARTMGLDEVEHRKDIRNMIYRWIKSDILVLKSATVNRNKVTYVHSARSGSYDAPTTDAQYDDDTPF